MFDLSEFLADNEEILADNDWYYVLDDDHTVKPEPDFRRWMEWMETRPEPLVRVDYTEFAGWYVSTVFLGIDLNIARLMVRGLPPLVFETMVFSPPARHSPESDCCSDDGSHGCCSSQPGIADVRRYATWAAAQAGHNETVSRWRALLAEIESIPQE